MARTDNNKPNRSKQRKTIEKKRSVKHSVLSVVLIDGLIENEQDREKLEILKKLRGEMVKVWQK